MHGHENAIDAGESEPEMNFAERFVQTASKKFGEPEKQRAENRERRGDAHHQMEMAGDEIVADGGGGEIMAREKNSGEAAGEKKRNETEREKHGGIELDAGVPESAEPTDEEDRGGQSERRSQQRKNQRRKGIHAAGKHVLTPNAKTKEAHAAQRQHHKAFFPNRLAGKRGNQVRDEAKARKHRDVDFGLREKPEETLPNDGNSVGDDAGRLIGDEIQQGEKVCVQEAVGEQADAGRQENAEN